VVAARECGFPPRERERIALGIARDYREWMARFATQRSLDVWYARVEVDTLGPALAAQLEPSTRKRASKLVAKARTHDSTDALAKLTRTVDGAPRIISNPPLIVPVDELAEDVREETLATLNGLIQDYRETLQDDRRVLLEHYERVDFAHKVVGVGSVGTQAWIALLLGRDARDALFLQVKEAQASVLEPFAAPSSYPNAGQRVVEGQRLMQASSDIFLGWLRAARNREERPRDFYVRQLRDWKVSADIERMAPADMLAYGRLCGVTLARAHARSGDCIAIASYLGTGAAFDRAVLAFAEAYADQNERDYAALAAAVKAGRVIAETGL
jgi:hypothetical protein